MKKYIYKYYRLKAKADYHKRNEEILTMELDNEYDPEARNRLFARRTHHRRLYRKYLAQSEQTWNTMR